MASTQDLELRLQQLQEQQQLMLQQQELLQEQQQLMLQQQEQLYLRLQQQLPQQLQELPQQLPQQLTSPPPRTAPRRRPKSRPRRPSGRPPPPTEAQVEQSIKFVYASTRSWRMAYWRLSQERGRDCSVDAVTGALRRVGLTRYIACQKPLTTEPTHQRRLAFATRCLG
ncbi:hypothetical protein BGZ61DRAFT_460612 [Ilyonectria robusta]|uniref:uncharacterized protein n=1 Tax=Ilyonectria robusta TaxID=1079257 RepID=UPI001E8E2A68|nr:uncharacterized protein BGZ61DRAFT_460612 [Ilyonectria robusta]KAH8669227.1 hypothetical protein BGZ61DRAFT_460612 [Ilyonectria robusta]